MVGGGLGVGGSVGTGVGFTTATKTYRQTRDAILLSDLTQASDL